MIVPQVADEDTSRKTKSPICMDPELWGLKGEEVLREEWKCLDIGSGAVRSQWGGLMNREGWKPARFRVGQAQGWRGVKEWEERGWECFTFQVSLRSRRLLKNEGESWGSWGMKGLGRSPNWVGHSEFKYGLLKMRTCTYLLSHYSLGIHVTWVKLTQNKSGNMTGTWPIIGSHPLTNCDWVTAGHMTQLDLLRVAQWTC